MRFLAHQRWRGFLYMFEATTRCSRRDGPQCSRTATFKRLFTSHGFNFVSFVDGFLTRFRPKTSFRRRGIYTMTQTDDKLIATESQLVRIQGWAIRTIRSILGSGSVRLSSETYIFQGVFQASHSCPTARLENVIM